MWPLSRAASDQLQAEAYARALEIYAQTVQKAHWPEGHLVGEGEQPVPFHLGQRLVHDAHRRFIGMFAGTQGGKTSYGPWWLAQEIRYRGGGDYLAVTASFDLFKLKMLPAFLEVFEHLLGLGRFWAGDKVFELKDPVTGEYKAQKSTDTMWGRVILRSALALGGLESATAKGAWLDEAGQDDFTVDAWKAIRRRLAIHQGRVLFTTTLYNLGWVKTHIIDPAVTRATETRVEHLALGQGVEAELEYTDSAPANTTLVQFDSIANPSYPVEEYLEAQATLPADEFVMQYRGRVTRLRYLIYDTFDRHFDTCPRFPIPPTWRRYLGLDFGGVHTAAVFYAEHPESRVLYGYREYLAGGKVAQEHVADLLRDEPGLPYCVGGSRSEGQWRDEFTVAGLPVNANAMTEVDLQIAQVYACHKQHTLIYFNDLEGLLDQKGKYRRKRDKAGEVTDEIENKNQFHFLDAERYIISDIRGRGLGILL